MNGRRSRSAAVVAVFSILTGCDRPVEQAAAEVVVDTGRVAVEAGSLFEDVARAIASRAPVVRRVDIPGAGHMLNLEAVDRFNEVVLEFLGSQRPPLEQCAAKRQ
jgi:pimeloyl-ACP methyl ester carboxylesterase